MYKLLLCWRYLRTRYIALICIVSVMLGVATMIVVNSVMAGFAHQLQTRMNGMLGDVIVESISLDGVFDADAHMARIRKLAGDSIEGITPTAKVPAIMTLETGHGKIIQQIMLVGVDTATYAGVSAFGEYLQHPMNRENLSFQLREGGYDVIDHQLADPSEAKPREQMKNAGWIYRRDVYAKIKKQQKLYLNSRDPFAKAARANGEPQGRDFDHAKEQHIGIVLGLGLASSRNSKGYDIFRAVPGVDLAVSFPNASLPPKAINEMYTVVDLYESGLPDFDSNFAFVPLRELQKSRGLIDPTTGIGKFNSIMIKLRPGADANKVRDLLRNEFPAQLYSVRTWRDQNIQILQAIQMETLVLNVLLFMIVAVAGFGIFAIFLMIVVEKTRDIGILKSLGASGNGVMGIFLCYGSLLGIVGAGAGLGIGLLIQQNINSVAEFISYITGQPVFDPSVYFFNEIPTKVYPATAFWICSGAIFIAVFSSIFPAWRASRLHPVKALRYE